APPQLQGAGVAPLPRAEERRVRGRPRGSDQGVRGRRAGACMSGLVSARKLRKAVFSATTLRGAISISALIVLWEVGRRLKLPMLGSVPAPSEVLATVGRIVAEGTFWKHWTASFGRILTGFIAAQIVGVPLGLMMAMSRFSH